MPEDKELGLWCLLWGWGCATKVKQLNAQNFLNEKLKRQACYQFSPVALDEREI